MKRLILFTLSILLSFTLCLPIFADDDYVATIGENHYATLQAAINAASNEQEIHLVKSTNESVTVASNKTISLVLEDGVILSNGENKGTTINNSGTLTIYAPNGVVQMELPSAAYDNCAIYNSGTLTLVSGEYKNVCKVGAFDITRPVLYNVGTLNVGLQDGETNDILLNCATTHSKIVNSGTLCINQGIFEGMALQNSGEKANATINNGQFTKFHTAIVNGGILTINDGLFEADETKCVGLQDVIVFNNMNSAKVTVNNGDFSYGDGCFTDNLSLNGDGSFSGFTKAIGITTINGGIFSDGDVVKYLSDDSYLANLELGDDGSAAYYVFPKSYDKKINVKSNAIAYDNKTYSHIKELYENTDTFNKDNNIYVRSIGVDETVDFENTDYYKALIRVLSEQDQLDNKAEIIPLNLAYIVSGDNGKQGFVKTFDEKLDFKLILNNDTVSKLGGKKYTLYAIYEMGDGLYNAYPVSEVKTTLGDTNEISFKSSDSSYYALVVYKEATPSPSPETKKEESSNDSKVVTCEEYMKSKDWTWSESKKACVYKVTNTSSK